MHRRKFISLGGTGVTAAAFTSFVGDVQVLQGLGFDLDQAATEAAQKVAFLPAIKDRKFVPGRMTMVMTFNTY